MKVKLLRDQRINHAKGEIVEVSPLTYDFLISTGSAVPVGATQEEQPKEEKKGRRTKK